MKEYFVKKYEDLLDGIVFRSKRYGNALKRLDDLTQTAQRQFNELRERTKKFKDLEGQLGAQREYAQNLRDRAEGAETLARKKLIGKEGSHAFVYRDSGSWVFDLSDEAIKALGYKSEEDYSPIFEEDVIEKVVDVKEKRELERIPINIFHNGKIVKFNLKNVIVEPVVYGKGRFVLGYFVDFDVKRVSKWRERLIERTKKIARRTLEKTKQEYPDLLGETDSS